MTKLATLMMLLIITATTSGCYNKRYIDVSQVKYLNRPGGKVYVQSASGKMINVFLNNDLIIRLKSGRRYVFKPPYECTLAPGGKTILVKSSNYSYASIAIDDIASAAVNHPSGWYDLAWGLSFYGGLALSLVLLGAIAAI